MLIDTDIAINISTKSPMGCLSQMQILLNEHQYETTSDFGISIYTPSYDKESYFTRQGETAFYLVYFRGVS